MKRFVLSRLEDVSEVSGIGEPAEGILFSNGKAVISWNTSKNIPSVEIYDNIDQILEIHGHQGRTQIRWIDG